MTNLHTLIDERIKEFEDSFVEMSPLHGRDMHNRPPLYDTDLKEVELMKKFLRTTLEDVARATADAVREEKKEWYHP